MMHSIKEVYKIEGDDSHNYSATAVQFLNHANTWKNRKPGDCYPVPYKTGMQKFRIYDNLQRTSFHIGYLYGQYHYFDSAEEREEYRAQMAQERITKQQTRINTINIWQSPYTGELVEVPADFSPNHPGWELVDSRKVEV